MIGGIQPLEPVQEQLERGGPAPGQRPALLRQAFSRAAQPHRDQLGRFAEREAQVGSGDLEQFTPPLGAAEPELGQAPAGQHQMERRRRLERQHPEQMARRFVVADMLQAVDDQQQVTLKRLREVAKQGGAPLAERMAVIGTGSRGDGRVTAGVGDSPSAAAIRAESDSAWASAGLTRTQRDAPTAATSVSAVVFP